MATLRSIFRGEIMKGTIYFTGDEDHKKKPNYDSGFVPEDGKQVSVINPISGLKNRNHMLIVFDEIQHHFTVKVLERTGLENAYHNKMKVMYDKPVLTAW